MKTIHVVAAVIIKDHKVFCCQRADKGPLAKKWEFPGGKIEDGEKHEDALVREIKEELKTEIKLNEFLMQVDHQYPTFRLIMDAYLCEIVSGDLTLCEHLDSKWLSEDKLDQPDWAEADIPIIEKLKEGYLL